MALRWTAAGMLEAERQFRRLIGYRDLAKLAVAVEREVTLPQPHNVRPSGPLPSPPADNHTRTVTEVPRRLGHPPIPRPRAARAPARGTPTGHAVAAAPIGPDGTAAVL
jgi:hypothetical protein